MTQISKEASTLYSMCTLMQGAVVYGAFLTDSKSVHYQTKHEVKAIVRAMSSFNRIIANGLPENERNLWLSQWKDKDYHSLIEIMRYAADMDDTKRGILEDAARAIFKGEFEVEQK